MLERRRKDSREVPHSEAILDEAVEYTFPASDPISIDHAFYKAREHEEVDAERASPAGS